MTRDEFRHGVFTRDNFECVVCRENKKCIAFDPCGCVCCCYTCSQKLLKAICPTCNASIKDWKKVNI